MTLSPQPALCRGAFRVLAMAFVIAAVMPCIGTAAPTASPEADAADAALELRAGDHVRFEIVEDGEPASALVVGANGLADIPYLGPVRVVGEPVPAVLARVRTALEREYFVRATVRLSLVERPEKSSSRGHVFLSGQVRRVGPVEIDKAEANTVSKVILAAGGLTDFADARRIKLVRAAPSGEPTTTIIDLKEVIEKGRIDRDVPLYDGDFVIVDSRLVNW